MKKKWFRTTDLINEEYLAEADPAQNKARKLPKRVWVSTLAACACLALVLGSLWLLKPNQKINPPRIDNHTQGSEDSNGMQTDFNGAQTGSNGAEVVVPLDPHDYTQVIRLLTPLKASAEFDTSMRPGDLDGVVDDAPTLAGPDSAVPDGGMNSGTGMESEGYVEVTDNQTAGVIEADRIKRTDKHIFYLDELTLRAFSIAGEESEELGSFMLHSSGYFMYDWEFFLSADGKTATVITEQWDETNKTTVHIIALDVSDPANITEKNRLEISGTYLSSRVTKGKILLMTKYGVNRYNMDFADERTFLPYINGKVIPACDIILPEEANNACYMVVLQLDENTLEIQDQIASLSYAQEVYVSQNHIFLTRDFSHTEETDGKKIQNAMTEITCLSYGDGIAKKGTVTVRGYLKDKWSMDEYEGILRVVTTTNPTIITVTDDGLISSISRFRETNASLYCVDLQSFQVVAKVEDFAPWGEDVQSVRFDKNTAYVCTAVQITDPVFFFDLSDLQNITYKETGNIDGFSTSLVDFGDGYLLGIGREDWSTFKVEIYRETETGVESVCKYTCYGISYSTDYKSYYIDRENRMIGLGTEYSGNTGYLLIYFDGQDVYDVFWAELKGDLGMMRGVYIDGYIYMFGAEDFHVENVYYAGKMPVKPE